MADATRKPINKSAYVLFKGDVSQDDILAVVTNPRDGMLKMDEYQKQGQSVSFLKFVLPKGEPRQKRAD